MPIQQDNIVFLASQVMDDVPEGGGAITGTVIEDGEMNNIFPDISDLDRAYGRFSLRKIALAVRALNRDRYDGAKTVFTMLPTDPAVSFALFETGDPFDTRDQAADRVESYLYKGPMWHGYLYEAHITGMKAISVLQRPNTELPPIGRTLCLVYREGQPDSYDQYVRVVDVEASEQEFWDPSKQEYYTMWVVRMDLSDALDHDFPGFAPSRGGPSSAEYDDGTRLRDTTVADATRYYAAHRLAEPAAIGDRTVRAADLFTQLIPAAQSETPLVNQPMNPELTLTLDAGARQVDVAQQAHTLARPVTPENRRINWVETLTPRPAGGVLSVAFMSQGNWYVLQDQGNGSISGARPGIGAGKIDDTGTASITLGALPDAGSQILWAWGTHVHYRIELGLDPEEEEVQNPEPYTWPLRGPIIPDTISITYEGANGPATITGSGYKLYMGAEQVGTVTRASVEIDSFGDNPPATPDTILNASWDRWKLVHTTTQEEVDVTVLHRKMFPISRDGGNTFITLQDEPDLDSLNGWVRVKESPTSVSMEVNISSDEFGDVHVEPGQLLLSEDYAGGELQKRVVVMGAVGGGTKIGSLSGSTITLTASVLLRRKIWNSSRGEWNTYDYEAGYYSDENADLRYSTTTQELANTTDTESQAESLTDARPFIPQEPQEDPNGLEDPTVLTRSVSLSPSGYAVVPNSVQFKMGDQTFLDRNGRIYQIIDGSEVDVGSMIYDAGVAMLRTWTGLADTAQIESCLIRFGNWTAAEASFRSANAPLKPESLQVTATTPDGFNLTATADADGNIQGPSMSGQVNYQFGTANVKFGDWVLDSELTPEEKEEDWYDPANIQPNGTILKPRVVLPSTIRYNAVAYSYLPLDKDILGIDAVRLPSDGRVPVYRAGDIVLVMHSQEMAPQTVTAGETVSLGRTRIGWVRIVDAAGADVTDYTLDRANGTVTFGTDLTGVTQPVTIRHTVADMRMITDAQITGHLTLSMPLTHDFPADETIVSSALIHGDRRARVSATWDEESWNGAWADAPQGDEATATLNLIDFPIEVTNEGCDTERWLFRCTNSSTHEWELIGENRGKVWSGVYAPGGDDVAPINPRTRTWDEASQTWTGGTPYLTIPADANGGGWSTGNVVRINTVGALAEFWISRSIQQSDPPLDDGADRAELYALGNVDRP